MKKILLSTALCVSMMFAANSEYKYEVTPLIGGVYTEGNLDLDRNYGVGGLSIGANLENSMFDQVEMGILRSIGDVEYSDDSNTSVTRAFANVIKDYSLTDSVSLYGLIGAGVEFFNNEKFDNENGLFANYGVGIKYKISDAMSLKADVRHLVEFDHGDNNLLYTIGLAIPFGKKATPVVEEIVVIKDSDNDGVIDSKDQCPNSAVGAIVDEKGCEIDSDMDGVVDSLDRCPNTPKGNIVDEQGCSLKVDLNINFKTDSAVINNSYDSKIRKFADFMKAFPSVKADIKAYTDWVGSKKYNQKLSERRAASAVKALETYGIEASRLDAKGYGEMNPIAPNTTAEGRAQNRRVEGSIKR